jgi:hypothetical protein
MTRESTVSDAFAPRTNGALSRRRYGDDRSAGARPYRPRLNTALAACAAALAALLAAGCSDPAAPGAAAGPQPQRLPKAMIRVGDVPLEVEVADDPEEHRVGMMYREHLGPDEAMLFVFPHEATMSYWMKNTPSDLDLAYADGGGRIFQIVRMTAYSTASVYSREPARFVLEVPPGWFARHGVAEGTVLAIPPALVAPAQ